MSARTVRNGIRAILDGAGALDGFDVQYGELPTAPDRAVAITPYAIDEHRRRVQIRVRGRARSTVDAADTVDRIADVLRGASSPEHGIELVTIASSSPLGADSTARHEHVLNVVCVTVDPGTSTVDL